MRSAGTIATAMLLAANIFGALGAASPAGATTKEEVALNGTYQVTSNGNMAKINRQYNQEPVVTTTWTLSSTCTSFMSCSGTASSDQGWTAPLILKDGLQWYVTHDVPNWETCEDGTSFTGRQEFYFYPVDPNGTGVVQIGSPVLAGKDKTIGPSGACGQNQWLTIEMPLRLDRIG
ncbi:hypothetical protein A5707_05430 [Mycobacterium kyorinense]|uniref:Secreted protein n=1 Tax=Mycobacterium kyorinense TaxID=487514 RepID=A0A1A2Z0J0_9MYCO|nr:hypothetical protein [Mycobacterium kyorinense]OBI43153.1 hypothetical protein A5707_05430 [Mycobacterium kyorinense]